MVVGMESRTNPVRFRTEITMGFCARAAKFCLRTISSPGAHIFTRIRIAGHDD